MNFRYLSTLCLLWTATLGLLGCGGGAGTGGAGILGPGSISTAAPVQAGVYFDASSGHEFWGVISPNGRWYALNYKTAYPDIYSGDISGTGSLNASVSELKYQNSTNTFLSGSASITSSGSGKLSGTLSLITTPSIQPVVFNTTIPAGFNYDQSADLSAISGNWSGKLTSNAGEFGEFNIRISSVSGAISHDGNFASCQWNPSNSVATPLTTANIFTLTLSMVTAGSTTGCDSNLNGQTLTGIAFVTPGAGTTRRLIWVATTRDGHAISFKADR